MFAHLAQAWQRHWAGIMAADSTAAASLEPELPATVFVTPPPTVAGEAYATSHKK